MKQKINKKLEDLKLDIVVIIINVKYKLKCFNYS